MTRARDIANQGAGTYGSITADDLTVDTTTLVVDATNNRVGIGTSSPSVAIHLADTEAETGIQLGTGADLTIKRDASEAAGIINVGSDLNHLRFSIGGTEAARVDSSGNLLVGATSSISPFSSSDTGIQFGDQKGFFQRSSGAAVFIARQTDDGTLVSLFAQGTEEGTISVSGSAVSYNGGHLSRWSRLADDSKDTSIVKGTVMTNLDEMVVWSHEAVEAQDAVYDEEGNLVSEAVEAKEAYTEDNEQLNKMAVSSVEGDPNVAGVFVNWDDDDDFNDMNVAMTGDMVIRIASGTTVARGDLLMSAGDGTAKPQGDDIVRSKTIAKVTSTHVSHTYDDGSYLVPCVLMAC